MTIEVRHTTKRGGSQINNFKTYQEACEYITKLFKRHLKARLYVDDILKGESLKQDGKWNYYFEQTIN